MTAELEGLYRWFCTRRAVGRFPKGDVPAAVALACDTGERAGAAVNAARIPLRIAEQFVNAVRK